MTGINLNYRDQNFFLIPAVKKVSLNFLFHCLGNRFLNFLIIFD
jgi:hypothetical protein